MPSKNKSQKKKSCVMKAGCYKTPNTTRFESSIKNFLFKTAVNAQGPVKRTELYKQFLSSTTVMGHISQSGFDAVLKEIVSMFSSLDLHWAMNVKFAVLTRSSIPKSLEAEIRMNGKLELTKARMVSSFESNDGEIIFGKTLGKLEKLGQKRERHEETLADDSGIAMEDDSDSMEHGPIGVIVESPPSGFQSQLKRSNDSCPDYRFPKKMVTGNRNQDVGAFSTLPNLTTVVRSEPQNFGAPHSILATTPQIHSAPTRVVETTDQVYTAMNATTTPGSGSTLPTSTTVVHPHHPDVGSPQRELSPTPPGKTPLLPATVIQQTPPREKESTQPDTDARASVSLDEQGRRYLVNQHQKEIQFAQAALKIKKVDIPSIEIFEVLEKFVAKCKKPELNHVVDHIKRQKKYVSSFECKVVSAEIQWRQTHQALMKMFQEVKESGKGVNVHWFIENFVYSTVEFQSSTWNLLMRNYISEKMKTSKSSQVIPFIALSTWVQETIDWIY